MANKTLRYVGPHAAVIVPLPKGKQITVERNQAAEFDADIAKRLLQQKDTWEAAESEPAESKASAEPAPAKKGGK